MFSQREHLGQESMNPIGDDIAAAHNAPALMFGLLILGGLVSRDLPHQPRDVGPRLRADARLAPQRDQQFSFCRDDGFSWFPAL